MSHVDDKQWCEGCRSVVPVTYTVRMGRDQTMELCRQCIKPLVGWGLLVPWEHVSGYQTSRGPRGAEPPHVFPWDYRTTTYFKSLSPCVDGTEPRSSFVLELGRGEVALLRMLGYKVYKQQEGSDGDVR